MNLDNARDAETPEGITLRLRPAGPTARVFAFLIDLLIRFVVFGIAATILGQMRGFGGGMLAVLFFGQEWLYPVVFELLPGGATPGKRAMGLRVLMDTGLPVTPAGSVVRNLLRTVDFLPVCYAAGLLSVLLRRDFKRLGDVVAGTLVVHADSPRQRHTALPDAAPLSPPRPLSGPQQVAVLRLAGRARRLTPERLDELAGLLGPWLPPAPLTRPDVSSAQDAALARPGQRLLGLAQWVNGRR